jgi:cysteine desulfurase
MTGRKHIYLDHHATTPVDPRVLDAMLPYLREDFGNASSSTHVQGWRAAAAVDDARERIAEALGAEPSEIVFTSGATESNNLAIQGLVRAAPKTRRHIVSVVSEHPSVLEACSALEPEGASVTLLDVDSEGLVDPEELSAAITEQTALVSVMAANSEIGVLQPIAELAQICRDRGVAFHSDAAQALGKLPLQMDGEQAVDLLSCSGHKIYAPKGIGVLYVRKRRPRLKLRPLFGGGGQEQGLRPGTLAVPLIVALARALELCLEEREAEAGRLAALRELLLKRIQAGLSGVLLNGHPKQRLPANLNLSFEGVDGDRLLLALTDLGISSGSACASSGSEPSHVLRALGRSESLARASLRFGLGRGTTREEVEHAAARVVEEVLAQRR